MIDEHKAETLGNKGALKMRRSPAWQYFTYIDKNYAQCKICGRTISYLSTTANLARHIIRVHQFQLVIKAHSGEQKDADKNENHLEVSDIEGGSEEESSEELDKISSDERTRLCRLKRMKIDHPHHEENQTIKTELEDESMDENQHISQKQNGITISNLITISGEKKRPRSSVWRFITKLDNGCFRCKICQRIMSKKSRMSNLLRHLKRTHSSFEDMTTTEVQRRNAESEVSRLNQLPEGLRRELGRASPIIHTFEREAEPTSTQTAFSSEKQFTTVEQIERICKSRTVCGDSDAAGRLLSERLVRAVEEGNHLLRSLQSAVERQGEALDRLVMCLEGLYCVPVNDVNEDVNQVQKDNEIEDMDQVQRDNENESLNEMPKNDENEGMDPVQKNGANKDVNQDQKDENEGMDQIPKNVLNEGINKVPRDNENEGINQVQNNDVNKGVNQDQKD